MKLTVLIIIGLVLTGCVEPLTQVHYSESTQTHESALIHELKSLNEQRKIDKTKAIRLLAEQGDLESQIELASRYRGGIGVKKDKRETEYWEKMAAETYLSAAIQGDVHAQLETALRYNDGTYLPEDKEEAMKWYNKALTSLRNNPGQGDGRAQYSLGTIYMTGEHYYGGIVPKNYKQGMMWLEKAAELGLVKAQERVGMYYDFGSGHYYDAPNFILRNDTKAVKWYTLAAENGSRAALQNLGNMYSDGEGVAKDCNKAMKLYMRSAELGYSEGPWSIAINYRDGTCVEKNIVKAYMWFIIAGAQDISSDFSQCHLLSEEMTPSQITDAEYMAREWLTMHD